MNASSNMATSNGAAQDNGAPRDIDLLIRNAYVITMDSGAPRLPVRCPGNRRH